MISPAAYRLGASDHSTFAIWRELAKGFDRLLVAARAQGAGGSWENDGVTVKLIRGFWRREIEFLLTQFALVPVGRRFRPNVVVSQGPPLGGFAALVIARLTGAGTLIELHGAEFVGPAPLWSRNGFLQLLSGIVLRRASLIRVLTKRMAQSVIERYGQEIASRIRVLPPRVDLTRFAVAKRRMPQNRLSVAMVGALNENKGQLRLARLLADADLSVDLHLAGDGPQRDQCDEYAKRINDKSNLRLFVHGHLPPDGVAALLSAADLLVMYSHTEGTPRAILEAMASGLPIITTRAGFCGDIVSEAEGFVLGDDPDREIVGTLLDIRRDPSVLIAKGAAARARAEREFDAAKLYPRYRALIAEAASVE